ncbi:DUF4145 domain-containing protein [Sphaerisporangium aureirubrum]|uniref:DUF4145 domain-containing protein n=1 Tax=Sphaerisporangium aureirubrum TaxID=1544736 RepID=A0ABW1NCZ7_9ACTN
MGDPVGHAGVKHFTIENRTDSEAYAEMICGNCGRVVVAAVIAKAPVTYSVEIPHVQWLRCPTCHLGTIINGQVAWPSAASGSVVDGLPQEVHAAYEEARRTAGISAFTSSELMCRKILMHVAVDKGEPAGKAFAHYLSALETMGYITPAMKTWVDMIRQHGNIATHEIPAADQDRALMTLEFTEQMLRIIYEMEHRAKKFQVNSSAP